MKSDKVDGVNRVALGRFWIEGLRTDSLMLGSLRIAQIVSIVGIAAGLILFFSIRRKNTSDTM